MICTHGCLKYSLFSFNLLIWLVSFVPITIGVLILVKWKVVETEFITALPAGFIIVGVVMFTIAFLGCCGAIRESHCMVVAFVIILLLVVITQVVATILMFVYDDQIKDGIVKSVDGLFKKKFSTDVDNATEILVNNLQHQFECCGVNNGEKEYSKVHVKPPPSCCDEEYVDKDFCAINYYPGCAVVSPQKYDEWRKPIAGAIIGLCCAELIAIIFTMCFANSISNAKREFDY